ncbi:hypothetical protein CGMCC3_g16595 [Colletotrichum fructicola]|nr:uncharacterized protein CGMCC3_g16595 [Colletotrichum fructicola]KAE9567303.1 hypothetical protein CGMCC3_g16595 [Colletotrichum fructicola]
MPSAAPLCNPLTGITLKYEASPSSRRRRLTWWGCPRCFRISCTDASSSLPHAPSFLRRSLAGLSIRKNLAGRYHLFDGCVGTCRTSLLK